MRIPAALISIAAHAVIFLWCSASPHSPKLSPLTWMAQPTEVWPGVGKVAPTKVSAKSLAQPDSAKKMTEAVSPEPAERKSESFIGDLESSLQQFQQWGNQPPRYPPLATEKGWEGRVKIRLVFKKAVPEVFLLETSGYDLLDQAAIKAAESWKLPSQMEAQLSPESKVSFVVPILFKIEE